MRARIPLFTERGVSLVVVNGDLIEARREEAGGLSTTEAFAEAIADAAGDPELKSGDAVYVGSVD